ncbi:MAG: undecaprenyldiphospho-muramoylpentapeptide beta-N-acetylglucosaminyltransferase [Pseudomonadota bacterium]
MVKILVATGGTGGHIFPAQALAEQLQIRGATVGAISNVPHAVRLEGGRNYCIRASAMNRQSPLQKAKSLFVLGIGFLQACLYILKSRPQVVVGFGGYATVPTILAAWILRRPIILHEQNAYAGQANRFLARFARHIAVSFAETGGFDDMGQRRFTVIGNLVRPEFSHMRQMPYGQFTKNDTITLLITGGSQGAKIFSDILPKALAILPKNLCARLRIHQQVRAEFLQSLQKAYQELGIVAKLEPFIHDMPQAICACHLMIARAGASTLSEAAMVGRPCLLIPYPYATDDHQRANATMFADRGAGWLLAQEDCTAETLAGRLQELLSRPKMLMIAAQSAKKLGQPDAPEALADLVLTQAKPDLE